MRWFSRGRDGLDARTALREVGRRDRDLRWLRRIDGRELDSLVESIERDLGDHRSRDDLLEHAARLHYDASARREARGRRGTAHEPDDLLARSRAVGLIFERRYGVPLREAIERGLPADPEADEAHGRIERALRRLGVAYTVLSEGHWVYESPNGLAIHLRHYPVPSSLDVYTPVRPFDDDADQDVLEALLRRNGGSVGAAFWGICTFESAGDHVCACARVSTREIGPQALLFALDGVSALAEEANAT